MLAVILGEMKAERERERDRGYKVFTQWLTFMIYLGEWRLSSSDGGGAGVSNARTEFNNLSLSLSLSPVQCTPKQMTISFRRSARKCLQDEFGGGEKFDLLSADRARMP